jgi:hypothetical protein
MKFSDADIAEGDVHLLATVRLQTKVPLETPSH